MNSPMATPAMANAETPTANNPETHIPHLPQPQSLTYAPNKEFS
jgi:hypothetical protein